MLLVAWFSLVSMCDDEVNGGSKSVKLEPLITQTFKNRTKDRKSSCVRYFFCSTNYPLILFFLNYPLIYN
jgi:hypothetical protein